MIENLWLNRVESFDSCKDWLHPIGQRGNFYEFSFNLIFSCGNDDFFISRFLYFFCTIWEFKFILLFFGEIISRIMKSEINFLLRNSQKILFFGRFEFDKILILINFIFIDRNLIIVVDLLCFLSLFICESNIFEFHFIFKGLLLIVILRLMILCEVVYFVFISK